jgi:hypothetical protein
MENAPYRWRPQLSIRTLLELTAVAAVILEFLFARNGWRQNRAHLIGLPGRGLVIYDPDTNKLWQFTQDASGNGWTRFDGPVDLNK